MFRLKKKSLSTSGKTLLASLYRTFHPANSENAPLPLLDLTALCVLAAAGAHLYVICAIHHYCLVLLIVDVWSRLPQLFGLVPWALSGLYVCRARGREGREWSDSYKSVNKQVRLPEAQTSQNMTDFWELGEKKTKN